MNIECCDFETGRWQRVDTSWDYDKSGHIVENLISGHTYSFRIVDSSLQQSSPSSPSSSFLQTFSPSLSSSPVTIPHETGSWQQDHLMRRYRQLNNIIGRGRNSCVEEAEDNGTGHKVALKKIERQRQTQFTTRNEYKVLARISHHNIIHALALFENAPSPGIDTIVLELVQGHDVCSFICQYENFEMKVLQSLMNQLMCALGFLEEKFIAHCDIKPENLMVEVSNSNKVLKIIDFGSAISTDEKKYPYSITIDLEFSAPELLKCPPIISNAADIWSAGVVFYILLSGVSPFLDESYEETVTHIQNQDFSFPDEYFSDIPDSAKDMISGLLRLDMSSRLSASTSLESVWIKQDVSNVTIKTDALRNFHQRRQQQHGLMQHIILSDLKT